MGAVTERLVFAASAGTVGIGLSAFEVEDDRFFSGDNWLIHKIHSCFGILADSCQYNNYTFHIEKNQYSDKALTKGLFVAFIWQIAKRIPICEQYVNFKI